MNASKTRVVAAASFLALLGTYGCSSQATDAAKAGKPKVVATFSVLGDFVRNVGDDRVELTTLVGPDGDAHSFEPSPRDGITLAQADVIFANGAGFETWLPKLYSASQSKAPEIVASAGLKLHDADEEDEHAHANKEQKKEKEAHNHGSYDPHVWHDVQNAMRMVENIRDGLVKVDPAHAQRYQDNATAYLKQLKELDQWVVDQVAGLPAARRKLVTNHDTFGYFAARYGFTIVGTALGSLSTEAADPSSAAFVKLCDSIKAEKVPVIFTENIENAKLVERLAQQAGVKIGPPLFTDALGKPGTEGDTYVKMMRYNVSTIVNQLKP